MPKCRFTGYNHYHNGERLEQGDVVELSEAHYEQWSYQFERLDSDEDSSDDAESDSANDADEVHDGDEESPDDDMAELAKVVAQSVPDMENLLETGEYDDRLDELYELEVENKDRTTAKEAIDERRED